MNSVRKILALPRQQKRIICAFVDIIFIIIAFFSAYYARWGHLAFINNIENWYALATTLVFTVAIFFQLGLYKVVLRYLSFHALFLVSTGAVLSAMVSAVSAFYFYAPMPRTVPIIYGAFLGILCIGSRLLFRYIATSPFSKDKMPIAIYGAGSAGYQLALSLRNSDEYALKAFIDENKSLKGQLIQGVRVSTPDTLVKQIKYKKIQRVLLALPRASRAQRKRIIDNLSQYPVEVLTVPDLSEIISGKSQISELKNVAIDDLLGRDIVPPQKHLLQSNITNKVVMVTGAGGSIGSELCRQIIQQSPKVLILFDISI